MSDEVTIFEGQVAMPARVRVAAADADVVLTDADEIVHISSAAGSAGTLSSALTAGGKVTVYMTAFDTNAYTLAVTGGTLTFNAANETATVYSDGSALFVENLRGATIV